MLPISDTGFTNPQLVSNIDQPKSLPFTKFFHIQYHGLHLNLNLDYVSIERKLSYTTKRAPTLGRVNLSLCFLRAAVRGLHRKLTLTDTQDYGKDYADRRTLQGSRFYLPGSGR